MGTEWWPADQVSLCIPAVLVMAGVLGPQAAFAGFAGTAVVTIAGILVVSDGLVRTGAVQFVGDRIIHWSRGDERKLLLLVMLTMLLASIFVNNTAIVTMFLPVLFLIGGALSLGEAMQTSGTADLIASEVVVAVAVLGPHALLATVCGLTLLLTAVMTNNVAAVLMVPLAVSAAGQLGLDPRPFTVAVAFAGSAAFATPTGHQTNTLVCGVGAYEFRDFARVGLPLNLLL